MGRLAFIVSEAQGPELFGPADFWPLDIELRKRLLEERRSKPFYAIQPIAMFQTAPERSEVFYDLSLYQDADVIITTGAVRSRYLQEPERFAAQIRFYDALERTFQKVHQIDSKGKQGSTITIYRRPNSDSFGLRLEPAGPEALRESPQTSAKSRVSPVVVTIRSSTPSAAGPSAMRVSRTMPGVSPNGCSPISLHASRRAGG